MKRYVLTAIILATLIFTICSCSEKVSESKAENTETTIESFITSKNVYDTIVETKKIEKDTIDEKESDELPIGGEHMGDELYSPYGFSDILVCLNNTFTQYYAKEVSAACDAFSKLPNSPYRPSLVYYIVKEVGLTREDLEIYYGNSITEDEYRGLLTDDLSESMQLLKTKYAFYRDGALYTYYDIRKMSEDEAKVFTEGTEYADVWKNILEYMEQSREILYGEKNIEFVENAVRNTEVKE